MANLFSNNAIKQNMHTDEQMNGGTQSHATSRTQSASSYKKGDFQNVPQAEPSKTPRVNLLQRNPNNFNFNRQANTQTPRPLQRF